MSTALQEIRKDIDAFKLIVRDWTSTLPIFNAEVKNIQRRTARRFAIEYINEVDRKVSAKVREADAAETYAANGRVLRNVIINMGWGWNVQPDGRSPAQVMIILSPRGEVAVTRATLNRDGVLISPADFHARLDEIKRRIGVEPIDIDMPSDLLVQEYLVQVYRKIVDALPTFRKAE